MDRYTTAVTETLLRTPGAMSVRMAKPSGFAYRAGQWAIFTLAGGAGRTLTLSSSPTEPFLEFTKRLTGSDFSAALSALGPGDPIGVMGPGGAFFFPEGPGARPGGIEGPVKAAFLTGGIGVTPFRSILRDQADRGLHPDRVFLFFNRNITEVPFGPELEEMARRDATLRLVHILEDPPAGWTGWAGRISREILEKELPDPGARTFFVCGPPPMVAAVDTLLAGMGVDPSRVRKESFLAQPGG